VARANEETLRLAGKLARGWDERPLAGVPPTLVAAMQAETKSPTQAGHDTAIDDENGEGNRTGGSA
jgi:hypothetical protein